MAYNRNGQRPPQTRPTDRRQEPPPEHDEPEQSEEDSRKPVMQFNYPTGTGSQIWVSIWDASYESNGKTKLAFNVTWVRSYYHDNKWKSAMNVRSQEIHVLIHALSQAQQWCLEATRQ